MERERATSLAGLAPAGMAGLALLLAGCSGGEEQGPIPVRVIAGDLLAGDPPWEVVHSNPRQAPEVRVITPSNDYRLDGADMPALMLPPPAEVRFRVPDDAGQVSFMARAGVDHTSFRETRWTQGATAVLSVLVDGEQVFEEAIPVGRGSEPRGWSDVGGPEGLALRGGQEVVLRTVLRNAEGHEFPKPVPVPAAFGGCLLEEVRWRPRAASSPERPSVVLIVMDTERADRLSAYGYGLATSPRLEELAARGVLFECAHSTASWTWPSTASILTGLLPEEHGVLDDDSCYLAHGLTTLAEAMQLEGATTAAWSANPLVVPEKNFDQGFELFSAQNGFRKSEEFLAEVDDFLERVGDRRFLLYLHLTDPHGPHLPAPEARAEFAPDVPAGMEHTLSEVNSNLLRGEGHTPDGRIATEQVISPEKQQQMQRLYDASVRTGDLALGRVLDALERLGLDDRTVIAYTADHGEELFERGLVGHGNDLFQESVRVPLVLAGPGVPAGLRVSAPVSNRHVAPTLARLARTELPLAPDGIDLVQVARSPETAEPEILFSTRHGWWNGEFRQPLYGLREGNWVLHWAPEGLPWGVKPGAPGAAPGQRQLFDLSRDPFEQQDLAESEPERADELQARLKAMVEALQDRRTAPALEAGAATLEMLRDVGYMDGVDEPGDG